MALQAPPTAQKLVGRFLSIGNSGVSDDKNLIGDYSDAGLGITEAWVQPPDGCVWVVNRMMINIRDTGSFDADNYGNNITLTNGIAMKVMGPDPDNPEGPEIEYLDAADKEPILTNAGWGILCYDIKISSFGSGDEYLHGRWTFARYGKPLVLSTGVRFVMYLHDDFSGLVNHTFLMEGYSWHERLDGSLIN